MATGVERYNTPGAVRAAARNGDLRANTAGHAPGHVQANLVVLPRALAYDFLVFAQRNPRPCPVLEVLDAGDPRPHRVAPGADVRTDLPGYSVYRHGERAAEVQDIRALWRADAVAFLIGCSFTFEAALIDAGVPLRHVELGGNVPMYDTSLELRPSGPFHGRMVVSMRPIPAGLVSRAVEVTAAYPAMHGAPIHVGAPEAIGIADPERPDYGDPVPIAPGEQPVFWACGVTPQAVAAASRPEWMICHSPGKMFVTDLPHREFDVRCAAGTTSAR
jgi:uncharacterized protein YcsI (UPF0317 family)